MPALADEAKTEVQQAINPVHIRNLAASCVVCHGVSNNAEAHKIPFLAGMRAAEFSEKLRAFKSGERTATVMHQHAKGLKSQEITDLATFFSAQSPRPVTFLPTQKLLENHVN